MTIPDQGAPLKISDVHVYLVSPDGSRSGSGLTFVHLETDEGLSGFGECTGAMGGSSTLTGTGVKLLKDLLVGADPAEINRIWHAIYRRFTFLGSRGLPTHLASGVDIALWDLRGKTVGQPVYNLIGGKMHDAVALYANGWFDLQSSPEKYAEDALRIVEAGHAAIKFDPFSRVQQERGYGQLPRDGEDLGIARVAAIREAVGPSIEILIDAHGRHDAAGPLQIVAGSHAMVTVPNFYRLEHNVRAIPNYHSCLEEPIDFHGGEIRLSDRPGLGHDLNLDYVRANLAPGWEP